MRNRPNYNLKRNFEIFDSVVVASASAGDAGIKHNITRQRAHQIVFSTAQRIICRAEARFVNYELVESSVKGVDEMRKLDAAWRAAAKSAKDNIEKNGERE